VWNCGGEGVYAVSDTTVSNNIIFNSPTGFGGYGHSQVSAMENVTVVNNTIYNCDEGLYLRWGGSNMVLANNAVYSPGKTAVNSSWGINGSIRSNYVEGNIDVPIDNDKFLSGGSYSSAFVNASNHDFWPKTGSVLMGQGYTSLTPSTDFNSSTRTSPYDVGAYETEGLSANPGWRIVPGFKSTGSQDSKAPAIPTNLVVQ